MLGRRPICLPLGLHCFTNNCLCGRHQDAHQIWLRGRLMSSNTRNEASSGLRGLIRGLISVEIVILLSVLINLRSSVDLYTCKLSQPA